MITLRTIEEIEADIFACKETFDTSFFEGAFYGHYSRISLQREWQALQNTVAPLVAELHEAEQALEARLQEFEWEQVSKTTWNIKRKKKVAA